MAVESLHAVSAVCTQAFCVENLAIKALMTLLSKAHFSVHTVYQTIAGADRLRVFYQIPKRMPWVVADLYSKLQRSSNPYTTLLLR